MNVAKILHKLYKLCNWNERKPGNEHILSKWINKLISKTHEENFDSQDNLNNKQPASEFTSWDSLTNTLIWV